MKSKICIIFDNKNLIFNKEFDHYFNSLKQDMKDKLMLWYKEIKSENIPHIPIATKKYRSFILFINKIADKRAMVIRIKNSEYIEVHLSDHKYYDEQRKRFGIKKCSKKY
ncbi:hypothetical protein HN415_06015 [Candidatus Woesearchaeota archaeon]|jgi:hypothetical protein|nr:hypothetical protein [Candidatus Woesearchaeota archaeon]